MGRANWSPFHAQIHQTLLDRALLPQHSRILVALSGGQDSLCLAKVLLDLQDLWHWQLAIVHCDHGWRPDSASNADHVRSLAQTWQLPFYLRQAESPPASEAQARYWRYECFTQVAQQADYSVVVTGHTASDRAETLLYNLLRGSGSDGLQALKRVRSLAAGVQLVRPLLEITRSSTELFCQTHELSIWPDSTNEVLTYRRNRIRLELIPYLQTHFNPRTEQQLAQTAEILSAEVEYLEAIAQDYYTQAWCGDTDRLHRVPLQVLAIALQRRIVHHFLGKTLQTQISFDHIEKVVALIAAPNRTQTEPLHKGISAIVQGEWIGLTHKC